MLMLDDIANLWELRDERYAVQVVKHDHVPKEDIEVPGRSRRRKYEKKNWSSVMLFNSARCTALTPEYVNTASGLELHQFKWLGDDALIGELPPRWNHLVGYDPPRPGPCARALHRSAARTSRSTRDCEYSRRSGARERAAMEHAESRTGKQDRRLSGPRGRGAVSPCGRSLAPAVSTVQDLPRRC